MLEDPISKVV